MLQQPQQQHPPPVSTPLSQSSPYTNAANIQATGQAQTYNTQPIQIYVSVQFMTLESRCSNSKLFLTYSRHCRRSRLTMLGLTVPLAFSRQQRGVTNLISTMQFTSPSTPTPLEGCLPTIRPFSIHSSLTSPLEEVQEEGAVTTASSPDAGGAGESPTPEWTPGSPTTRDTARTARTTRATGTVIKVAAEDIRVDMAAVEASTAITWGEEAGAAEGPGTATRRVRSTTTAAASPTLSRPTPTTPQ